MYNPVSAGETRPARNLGHERRKCRYRALAISPHGASRSCRFVGARPSGRFSVKEPTRLEFSETWERSDRKRRKRRAPVPTTWDALKAAQPGRKGLTHARSGIDSPQLNSDNQQTPVFPPFNLPDEPRAKISWTRFFIVLLAPAVTTLIALFLNFEALVMLLPFGGSLVAGVVCSSMLARGSEESFGTRALRALALAAASFIFCFGGCAAVIAFGSR